MKIDQLHQIVEVYHAGSINKAAQNLYIAQSTLSNSIQSVESELGLEIFSRSKRGIEITEFGKKFIKHSMNILESHQAILEDAKLAKQIKSNHKIGISVYYLLYANRIFYQIYNQHNNSNIDFFYQNNSKDKIIEDVEKGISEIGLICLPSILKDKWLELIYSHGLEFFMMKKEQPTILFGPPCPLYNMGLKSITTKELQNKKISMITLKENTEFFKTMEAEIVKKFDPLKQIQINDRGLLTDLILHTNGFFVATMNENAYKTNPYHPNIQSIPVIDVDYHYEIGWIKKQNTPISDLSAQFLDMVCKTIHCDNTE